jgi:hypothetical protein
VAAVVTWVIPNTQNAVRRTVRNRFTIEKFIACQCFSDAAVLLNHDKGSTEFIF